MVDGVEQPGSASRDRRGRRSWPARRASGARARAASTSAATCSSNPIRSDDRTRQPRALGRVVAGTGTLADVVQQRREQERLPVLDDALVASRPRDGLHQVTVDGVPVDRRPLRPVAHARPLGDPRGHDAGQVEGLPDGHLRGTGAQQLQQVAARRLGPRRRQRRGGRQARDRDGREAQPRPGRRRGGAQRQQTGPRPDAPRRRARSRRRARPGPRRWSAAAGRCADRARASSCGPVAAGPVVRCARWCPARRR